MRQFAFLLFMSILTASAPTWAKDAEPQPQILITNVSVFDGVHEKRIEHANVLVEGNLIKQVSTDPLTADSATVIDGGGRTMIPGLIDAHWHVLFNSVPARH